MSEARDLPSVHALVDHPALEAARRLHGHPMVVDAARRALDAARAAVLAGAPAPAADDLALAALAHLDRWLCARPVRVINATGVILHTNLGRAPLSAAAAEAMARVGAGYSDLEYDLERGERGSRHDLVSPLLCRLTGAEAALVVNNNAGATLLVLAALAGGRSALVSRGQLVEIGGGFRIPAIMAAGGVRLVEVGTTNRTHLADYRAALDGDVGLILRVHASNFRILGFTCEVDLPHLVALGAEAGVPVIDDLGSGTLLDTAPFGLAPEPIVTDSIARGAALVTFSGDKLLGGPQAGVIAGRADLVARLRAHPFTRALRPDKATLAALHATLLHYARGEALASVPVWRMIAARPDEVASRAGMWRDALRGNGLAARTTAGASAVGGGSLPGESLPTTLLAIDAPDPERVLTSLRTSAPVPVIARVQAGAVLLDPRTVLPEEDDELLAALAGALSPSPD